MAGCFAPSQHIALIYNFQFLNTLPDCRKFPSSIPCFLKKVRTPLMSKTVAKLFQEHGNAAEITAIIIQV